MQPRLQAALQAELKNVEKREVFLERAAEQELRDPDDLPPLDGDALVIDWDIETRDGEHRTVLRHAGREIWQEIAYYEGYERFEQVFHLLHRRYGSRLAEVRPTLQSKLYLYGDQISAPQFVASLNATLRDRNPYRRRRAQASHERRLLAARHSGMTGLPRSRLPDAGARGRGRRAPERTRDLVMPDEAVTARR